MSLFDGLRYRLKVWLNPSEHEQEIDRQVEHHLELETMQLGKDAHTITGEQRAAYAARRRFGNVTLAREEARQAAGLALFDSIRQDARFALRTFARNKSFTAVTVLTLALGIGANTAIFSAVNTLLLRALPFRDPDQLMSMSITRPAVANNGPRDDLVWSWPKFQVFREAQTAFSSLALWQPSMFTARYGEVTVRVDGEFVEQSYLPTLGITPAVGRNFSPDEDAEGGPLVIILGTRLWDQLFNRSPDAIGKTIQIDGIPHIVVGIAPPSFRGMSGQAVLWMPLTTQPEGWGRVRPYSHNYFAFGRRAGGVSESQAKAAVQEAGQRVDEAYPETRVANLHYGAIARSLDSSRVDGRMRQTVLILFGAVGLVLLIACANVANLFLVRASGRRKEIAVRLAIGAGRARLIRQLLAESLVLALMGGAASIVVAYAGVKWLNTLQVASVLRTQNIAGLGTVSSDAIRLDPTALLFTMCLAVTTGVLFGLMPALQTTRPVLTDALKDDGAIHVGGKKRVTSRSVLVVAELAVAIVLLAGAGLTLRSLSKLLGVETGITTANVLTMRVNRAPEWSRDSIARFYDVAIDRLQGIPGVSQAAMIDCPPLNGCAGTGISRTDQPPEPVERRPGAGIHWITPGWLQLMGVPLIRGRLFTNADRVGSLRVALVTQKLATRLWHDEDPVGRRLLIGDNLTDTMTVAGVVGDVRFGPLDDDWGQEIFIPYHQNPLSYRMMIFVKTRIDPAAVAGPVRAALNEVAPGFPVYEVASMDKLVAEAAAFSSAAATLLTLFAALALGLATLGTYGVISYAVAQRRQEIGIRIALGASRADVLKLVVGQGIAMGAAGSLLGLVVAFAATRLLSSMLYNVAPTDPATLAIIVVVLLVSVLLASWLPARRAARVPAMLAMRAS